MKSVHRHACGRGHYWNCNGGAVREGDTESSECICFNHGAPMEVGDHSQCTIEILTCPEHRASKVPDAIAQASGPRVEDGFVPLEVPGEEILQKWAENTEPGIGFCLLCGHSITTVEELIPLTSTHNCAEGRAMEIGFARERKREQGGDG